MGALLEDDDIDVDDHELVGFESQRDRNGKTPIDCYHELSFDPSKTLSKKMFAAAVAVAAIAVVTTMKTYRNAWLVEIGIRVEVGRQLSLESLWKPRGCRWNCEHVVQPVSPTLFLLRYFNAR